MYSRKTLGTVALSALATAAVSFAVVDVSTSIGRSCTAASQACAHEAVPVIAITFAALGVLSLVVGIVPAVLWLIASIQAGRHHGEHADDEIARQHRQALRGRTGELDIARVAALHDQDEDAADTADTGPVAPPVPGRR